MFGSLSWSSYWILMVFTFTVMATVNESYQSDQYSFPNRYDPCMSKENCHACIQSPQLCAWCSAPNFTRPRCFSINSINSITLAECSEEFIQNPSNTMTIMRWEELSKANSSAINGHMNENSSFSSTSFSNSFGSFSSNKIQGPVRLAPQEFKLKLRARQPYTVSFSYAQLPNYFRNNLTNLFELDESSISSSVEIRDTASGNVKVNKYMSSCLEDGAAMNETAKCEGLQFGNNVKFFAEIEVTGCPTNRSEWHQKFIIYPIGIDENLTIDLHMICDCDCEHPSHSLYESQSAACNGFGTLKCGICECTEGHFGSHCECGNIPFNGDYSTNFESCRPHM